MSKRSQAQTPLVVLGIGPVGVFAALRARQAGLAVELLADRLPGPEDASRLEVVPAQLIALLVEYGVHPRKLGVERTQNLRQTQWRTRQVQISECPPSAHVARPALDLALLHQAEKAGIPVRVEAKALDAARQALREGSLVLDCTGRCAISAMEMYRPDRPLVCRTFTQPRRGLADLDAFAIAAGPDGYVYRLANARQVTLGMVGHGALLRGDAGHAFASIGTFAPWILEGIDGDALVPAGAGAASLQWSSRTREGCQALGDARIARDALASQGIALGVSDAMKAVNAAARGEPCALGASNASLSEHRRRVAELIADSPFASAPAWKHYVEFLQCEQLAGAE